MVKAANGSVEAHQVSDSHLRAAPPEKPICVHLVVVWVVAEGR
jgi:hypothetical protein